jgi:hypothetical protein
LFSLLLAQGAKMRANLFGDLLLEGTRVRPLIRDAQFGQILHNQFAFNFQFARQIVDPDFAHALFFFISLAPVQVPGR